MSHEYQKIGQNYVQDIQEKMPSLSARVERDDRYPNVQFIHITSSVKKNHNTVNNLVRSLNDQIQYGFY